MGYFIDNRPNKDFTVRPDKDSESDDYNGSNKSDDKPDLMNIFMKIIFSGING